MLMILLRNSLEQLTSHMVQTQQVLEHNTREATCYNECFIISSSENLQSICVKFCLYLGSRCLKGSAALLELVGRQEGWKRGESPGLTTVFPPSKKQSTLSPTLASFSCVMHKLNLVKKKKIPNYRFLWHSV